MIQQSLQNALERAGVQRAVVTLITQVVVDPADGAVPSREADRPVRWTRRRRTPCCGGDGLDVGRAAAAGGGWCRRPCRRASWRRTRSGGSSRDVIVIAAGGGGTPVYRDPVLRLEGVDAVIDKDRAAEVLGAEIGAGVLLILTNVDGAYRSFGTPEQELLRELRVAKRSALLAAGEFGKGSMGPKVEAACRVHPHGGQPRHHRRLDQGLGAVQGEAGTAIVALTSSAGSTSDPARSR
jgi:carbamate kinase